MASHPEVKEIADRYRCDPDDPVFGILEKVIEIRDQAPVIPLEIFDEFNKTFQVFIESSSKDLGALKDLLKVYEGLNQQANTLARNTGQNLIAASQIRLREKVFSGLIGMIFPTALLVAGTVWFFFFSLEAQISRGHLQLRLSRLASGTRVEIDGTQIVKSGQSSNKVIVEFKSE